MSYQNDRKLRGTTGAVTVLHTHNRRLDYHPHVHLVMPGAAFDNKQRRWRNKDGGYLFDHKALAKVFRARMLAGVKQAGLKLPNGQGRFPHLNPLGGTTSHSTRLQKTTAKSLVIPQAGEEANESLRELHFNRYPAEWVVDCKEVGSGQQALVYLGRYLYRGVIQEKDILSHNNGRVTFRYRNSQTKQIEKRSVSGVEFLRLILQHILPKGFRRARNFGFLHSNSKLIPLVQLLKRVVLPPAATAPGDTL